MTTNLASALVCCLVEKVTGPFLFTRAKAAVIEPALGMLAIQVRASFKVIPAVRSSTAGPQQLQFLT